MIYWLNHSAYSFQRFHHYHFISDLL
jgi:hypothetical protein